MEAICSIKYCSNCSTLLREWRQTSIVKEHCVYDEKAIDYNIDTETVDSYENEWILYHSGIDELLISKDSFELLYRYCVDNKVKGMPFKYDIDKGIEIEDDEFNTIMLESLLGGK